MIQLGDEVEVMLRGTVSGVDVGIPEHQMALVKFTSALPDVALPQGIVEMMAYIAVEKLTKVVQPANLDLEE